MDRSELQREIIQADNELIQAQKTWVEADKISFDQMEVIMHKVQNARQVLCQLIGKM